MSRAGFSRRTLLFAGAILAGLLLAGGVAVALLNPRLTKYIESEAFRAELEKQTAKGLHFSSGQYRPIKRTGFLTAQSAGFVAEDGRKALRSIDADRIEAKFNPLGVFLRRWQLDHVQIDGGEIGIQIYDPKPEPSPSKPWFHVFLPDRVYLKRVESGPADVIWRLQGERAGFFGTRLLITPHGRDFNYQATGGTLKMPLLPDLPLRETRLRITKTLLTLYHLELSSGVAGRIHAEGTAGTRDDKSVDFKISFEHLPIAEWLPADWGKRIEGEAFGKIAWRGDDLKLDRAEGEATLELKGARLAGLPSLEKIAGVTGEKALEPLTLRECSAEMTWNLPKAEIKNLVVEAEGKLRAEGAIRINRKNLDGTIELGVARALLDWLPNPEEVFSKSRDGYLWTTVQLSGTLEAPKQDLTPRIMAAVKDDPGAAFSLFFRQLGVWLQDALGGD